MFDGVVLIDGKRVEYLDLQEGEHVLCQIPRSGAGCTEVRVQGGRVICDECVVEQWGDCAVLRPKLDCGAVARVRQVSANLGGVTYTVTAVCERHCTNVWVEGTSSALYVLPRGEEVDVQIVEALSAVSFAVRREGRVYVVLVALYEDDVLYEGWVDDYSIDERLTVKCTFADMKRHIRQRVYGYVDGQFGLIEQSFTCASAHAYIPMLTPYLFAEALLVGAEDEAQGYLCEELLRDYHALREYVGTVAYVRRPPVSASQTDVGIVDDKGVGRVLSFAMEGDLIADVRIVGEA